MLVTLSLLGLALMVAMTAGRLLPGAKWTRRAPRLGIIAWQASLLTVLACGLLLASSALLPVDRVSFDIGHLMHACPVLDGNYRLWGESWLHLASFLLALATGLALCVALVRRSVAVRRGRLRQRHLLDLLVRREAALAGAHVLDHALATAYCVPGAGGRIVVTSAAVAALDERQLRAVLAHEQAHLDGRHDLVLFGAEVATTAFPRAQFFRTARRELSLLVEMLADDQGSRRSDRMALATALVDLGQAPVPEGALGAGGDVLERVLRLVEVDAAKPGRLNWYAVFALSSLLVAMPWVIAIAPVLVARSGLCQA